jgi:hypothetical protein
MRRFFEPASAPPWLKAVLGSIRAALGDIWDVPLRPFQAAAADLPAAAGFAGALAWNLSSLRVTWSDGTSWQEAQPYDAGLAAIAALSATGLAARPGAGAFALRSIAGTANQISVANGGGVLGDPTISLPAAMTAPGSLTVTTSLTVNGNAALGDAATDVHTVTGDCGFGTSAPASYLDGTRGLAVFDSSSPGIAIANSSRGYLFYISGSTLFLWDSTANADRLSVDSSGHLNVMAGAVYKLGGTQVLGARKTGWSTATGTATRTGFDTGTVTLAQLAERVKALIDDLHGSAGHGLIGS